MTDERMDARLRSAGEAWRAATPGAAEPGGDPADDLDVAPRRAHRPRRVALLASAAVVAAALVAGGSFLLQGTGGHHPANADATGLRGTVWRLVGVGNGPGLPNSLATFSIGKDDRFVADDSCQVMGGHADIEGDRLFLTPTDMRDKQCTDSAGELTFTGDAFQTLISSPRYSIAGTSLSISGASGPTLHLAAAPELPAPTTDIPSVEDAKWQLTQVTDGAGQHRPVAGAPTLQISDGRLVAGDGCNTIGADAAVEGGQVDLKNVGSTAVNCTGDVATTAAVIDAIYRNGATVHAQVGGTTLTVQGKGAAELGYRWLPDDRTATDPAGFTDRTWTLTSIAGQPAAGQVRLYASAVEASAMFGCGAVGGDAEVGAGTLRITGIPDGPAAGCSGDAADESSTVDSFLHQQPALWSIRDGKLLIYGGGAQAFSLVFTTQAPSVAPTTPASRVLLGTTWRLTGIETQSKHSAGGEGLSDSGITLSFGHDSFRFTSTCRSYTGAAHVSGKQITFSRVRPVAGDLCYGATALRASKVLNGTVDWSIDGGQLVLTNAGTTLTFDG